MRLLDEDKLIWSPTVANSSMNRSRQSSGINSYEREFKLKPDVFLENRIKEFGQSSWLDLCCGEGNALIQTASYFESIGLQSVLKLKGIDILDHFNPANSRITCLELETKSVVTYCDDFKYDLITCCHGISYLGDKLKVIEMAIGTISKQGLFLANIDLKNIQILNVDSTNTLRNLFKQFRIEYSSRTKMMKKCGAADISFGLQYLGADDTSGPNYSGQDAVTSYYSMA